MKISASAIATIAIGLAAMFQTADASTANGSGRHDRGWHFCDYQLPATHGFGGFTGGLGHPFLPRQDFDYRYGWGGRDPFWSPDPYYLPYDATAYHHVSPETGRPNGPGRSGHVCP